MPKRETVAEPYRSTSAPAGTEARALAPKYADTARPSPAGEKSSSSPICTARPPTRNTGIDTATVVVSAPMAARSGRRAFALVAAVSAAGIVGSAIRRRLSLRLMRSGHGEWE